MEHTTTLQMHALADRLASGDPQARRDVLERAQDRLRQLAERLLHFSICTLQGRRELDRIVNESWLPILKALEASHESMPKEYLRLAAHKAREALLDIVQRQQGKEPRETPFPSTVPVAGTAQPQDHSLDPARLALWTEFHDHVEHLASAERTVFEMHYYLALPQAEIASMLDLPTRQVSRLWVQATERLAEAFPQVETLF